MEAGARQGPIPVREMMAHLSEGERARRPDAEGEHGASPPPPEAAFESGGVTWVAREAGCGVWGTDITGAPAVVAVHFFHPDRPERPAREALLARGRLSDLHRVELERLFERGVEVPAEVPEDVARRRGGGRRSGRGGPRSGQGRTRTAGPGRSRGGRDGANRG